MDEKRLRTLLNASSVVLVAVLAAAFATVIVTALGVR